MLDYNELITIKWLTRNKKYYISLGYVYTKINDSFQVYLKDLLKNSSAHVTAICDCCGETQETPYRNYNKIIAKRGYYLCKSCTSKENNKKRKEKSKDELYQLFLSKCDEHDCIPITTKDEFGGLKDKVKYICPFHGETTTVMEGVVHGAWCYECGVEKRSQKIMLSPDVVKTRIEGKNNNKLLNPYDYKGADIKNLQVECGCCHRVFTTSYSAIMNGNGMCTECGQESSKRTIRENAKKYFHIFLEICKEMDYVVLSTIDEYKDSSTKLRFICPKHGEQAVSYAKFSIGERCPICGKENMKRSTLSSEIVEERINSVNNNTLLNPHDYYRNNVCNLRILCSCGNEYTTSLSSYESGYNRCPQCSKSMSKGELIIKEYLENNGIDFEQQYKFDDCRDVRPLPFDFYLKQYNTIIEFDGQLHYLPIFGEEQLKYTQYHDSIKNDYCKTNNINIIRIPYWNGDEIEEILDLKLNINNIN